MFKAFCKNKQGLGYITNLQCVVRNMYKLSGYTSLPIWKLQNLLLCNGISIGFRGCSPNPLVTQNDDLIFISNVARNFPFNGKWHNSNWFYRTYFTLTRSVHTHNTCFNSCIFMFLYRYMISVFNTTALFFPNIIHENILNSRYLSWISSLSSLFYCKIPKHNHLPFYMYLCFHFYVVFCLREFDLVSYLDHLRKDSFQRKIAFYCFF